jgi:ribulose 1,5-bisphosphate synthetase/thiazole synthase
VVPAGRGAHQECVATLTTGESEVAVEASPNAARLTDEIVDVLIIGAGASGATVAWSLPETRMRILCLEGLLSHSSAIANSRHSR